MLTITTQPTTSGAQVLRSNATQAVDEWIAAVLAKLMLDNEADVSFEMDCAAFVAELDAEAAQEVVS